MNRFVIIIILFSIVLSCRQQNKPKDFEKSIGEPKIIFHLYGPPQDLEKVEARRVIGNKWDIKFIGVAGCEGSKEFFDGVDKHNDSMDVLANKKYGRDWQKNFNEEIEIKLKKERRASSLLDKEKRIRIKQSQLDKEGNGLHYFFDVIDSTKYNVNIAGWGKINDTSKYVIYFRYLVDIKEKKVKLLNDSIMLMNYL